MNTLIFYKKKNIKSIFIKKNIMKFPSLIRLPKNKKFNVKPRHYDPIKDDIDQRVSKIKNEKKKKTFINKFDNQNEKEILKPGNLQLFLFLFLSIIFIGWLYYGNKIFVLLVVIPLIYFYKLKRKN
tara:strand:- start:751 stop:1128 length:378 start_codon:yes stop_codon:yes gene_type:complete